MLTLTPAYPTLDGRGGFTEGVVGVVVRDAGSVGAGSRHIGTTRGGKAVNEILQGGEKTCGRGMGTGTTEDGDGQDIGGGYPISDPGHR